MSLKAYQDEIDDLQQEYVKPYWDPMSQLARLAEEVGELARVYNHMYGDKVKKPTEDPDDLAGELGDIIFAVICMANTEHVDLDDALKAAIDKIKTRDHDRFERKQK